MTGVLDLTANQHTSRVLEGFLASRPGAAQRAGIGGVSNAYAVSSDSASMNALFQPITSSSGFAITDRTAMCVSTVYACLSKLSGSVLQLPIHQYRMNAAGDREKMEPTPIWWMLNEQPDDTWTAASWKDWIVRCIGLRGDQHTQILRSGAPNAGGTIKGLRPWHPDHVITRRIGHRLVYDVTDPYTGERNTVDQDDMLHFTGFGFDGIRSLSVVQWAARNAIGNELAASDYMGRTIGEGAMPQIALTYPNKMTPDQAELLRRSFVATYTGSQARKLPLILTEGGSAKELSLSAVDIELIASRRLEKQAICEAFGVPPIMIGDSEKTSSWGTGVEQITLGFVRFTLAPMLCRWEEELNRKLFRRAGMFVEFSLAALLRGDSKAQAEAFRAALGGPGNGSGWMSVDEVRKLQNLPAIGGDAATPFDATPVPPPTPAPAPNAGAQASMMAAITAMAGRETPSSTINVAAPVVNVTPPAINVQAGDTHMSLPEGLVKLENVVNTPDVNVGGISVQNQGPTSSTRKILRDANGDIAEIVSATTRQIVKRDEDGNISEILMESISQ